MRFLFDDESCKAYQKHIFCIRVYALLFKSVIEIVTRKTPNIINNVCRKRVKDAIDLDDVTIILI